MDKSLITADYAHQITNEILELRNQAEILIWELTKRLKEVRDKKLWEVEGEESFFAYLARPEFAFDRTTVLRWIQIYEVFVEKYALAPSELNRIGWTKLAKVLPHINENNYNHMLELAEAGSRSDIDSQLVKEGYVTKKEFEAQNVECPFCHKVFTPTQRKESHYPQEDYNRVIKTYEKAKETKFEGKEYDPLMSTIRTMFFNGRTPEQIIGAIEWAEENAEWDWTLQTIAKKIAEILPKLNLQPKEISEEDKRLLKGVGIQN